MWEEYTIDPQGDYISIDRWGKDHWSTFAYLETRAVDRGLIDNRQMRCNPRLHRELANTGFGGVIDGSKYPTRLRDGSEISNHDDWSCLEDMVAAGLIKAQYRANDKKRKASAFGFAEARVELTPAGLALAAQLRAHLATTGKYTDFAPAHSTN